MDTTRTGRTMTTRQAIRYVLAWSAPDPEALQADDPSIYVRVDSPSIYVSTR